MRPGPRNAITDVDGVTVGSYQRLGGGWATGTTVVLADAVAAVDVRGGGPGTRETDLLDPSHLVQQVQAVVLTGGSAYGLAAADGVMRWLAERNRGFRVGPDPSHVVPIVPAAVLFDLYDFGPVPDAEFGAGACSAAGAVVAQGNVGAGTGARAGGLKGGLGTASVVLDGGACVGAVVAVNPSGSVISPVTGRPWGYDHELTGEFALHPHVGADDLAALRAVAGTASRLNTTIGVVATDAPLTKAQCKRVAVAAHDGLARAVRPAHGMTDGDTMFALATGTRTGGTGGADAQGPAELDTICAATAYCVARAIVHAVLAAESLAGVSAYRDVAPSAFLGPA